MKAWIISGLFLFLWMELIAAGNEKKYEKTFPKGNMKELILSSSQGKMEIIQDDEDDIRINAVITVTAKTDEKAAEILSKINIKDVQTDSYLSVATEFGKNVAIRQFLSGVDVRVEYKVNVPVGMDVRVTCTEGDLFFDHFEGRIDAEVRNGNFKAAELKGGEFTLKQEKGNCDIVEVDWMRGELKNCDLNIESGNDVRLVISGCDGVIGSVNKLNLRSSGGKMQLGNIEELTGSSSFTKYELQDLGNSMDMDMKMGEMNVRNIHFTFSEIRLKGSFTKVGLTFMKEAGYNLEIKHNKSLKMDLPQGVTLEERPTPERNMLLGTQFIGNSQYKGKVFLELSNGNLYIQ